jgi:hypothetical protein
VICVRFPGSADSFRSACRFLFCVFIISMLPIVSIGAQESPSEAQGPAAGDDYLGGDFFSGDLQAPQDTVFLLPDVIVDLADPEYEDVETLLLGTERRQASFSLLPDLGDIGTLTGAQPLDAEIQEDPEAVADLWSGEIAFSAGYPLGGSLSGDIRFDGPSGDVFIFQMDNRYRDGSQYSSYRPRTDGFASRSHLLELGYRGEGLFDFGSLGLSMSEDGLQDLAAGSLIRVNALDLASSFSLLQRDLSWGLLDIRTDVSGKWESRRVRNAGEVQSSSSADVISADLGLTGSIVRRNAGFDLGFNWQPWLENSGSTGAEGNPGQIRGRLSASLGISEAAEFHVAWLPGLYGSGWAPADFIVDLELVPIAPWRLRAAAGLTSRTGDWAELQRDYPLHLIPFALSDGLHEQYWFADLFLLNALGDTFRIESDISLRYYTRQLSIPDWDAGGSISVVQGWYLGGTSRLAWYMSESLDIGMGFRGSILGLDIRDSSRVLEMDAEYRGRKIRWGAGVSMGLENGLSLPLISLDVQWDIGEFVSLGADVSDPLALLTSEGRNRGPRRLNPLSDEGFSAEIVTIIRF